MDMQLSQVDTSSSTSGETTRIVTSRLFDPQSLEFLEDLLITVHTGSGAILRVSRVTKDFKTSSNDIDLRGLTVLPGFVDVHVHCTLA